MRTLSLAEKRFEKLVVKTLINTKIFGAFYGQNVQVMLVDMKSIVDFAHIFHAYLMIVLFLQSMVGWLLSSSLEIKIKIKRNKRNSQSTPSKLLSSSTTILIGATTNKEGTFPQSYRNLFFLWANLLGFSFLIPVDSALA